MLPSAGGFAISSDGYFCLMCSPMYLLYVVVQDFVQKALFSECRQLEVGDVTMYDKG